MSLFIRWSPLKCRGFQIIYHIRSKFMKTKQILTAFLAVLLAGGSFVSCGGETPSETQADTDTAVIEETEPEETQCHPP